MLRTTTRLSLALVAGLALACFAPPSNDVLFACEPMGDDRCPTGYTCEADGCCHKNGTDVQASYGVCGLGGNETDTGSETATETTGSETDTTDATDTETTDTTETTETTDTTDATDTDTDSTETGTDTTDATDTDSTSG